MPCTLHGALCFIDWWLVNHWIWLSPQCPVHLHGNFVLSVYVCSWWLVNTLTPIDLVQPTMPCTCLVGV